MSLRARAKVNTKKISALEHFHSQVDTSTLRIYALERTVIKLIGGSIKDIDEISEDRQYWISILNTRKYSWAREEHRRLWVHILKQPRNQSTGRKLQMIYNRFSVL